MPSFFGEQESDVLGDMGPGEEFESKAEEEFVDVSSGLMEFGRIIPIHGPTRTVNFGVDALLEVMLDSIVEDRRGPWTNRAQLMRFLAYYGCRAIQHARTMKDPRLMRALAEQELKMDLEDARERDESRWKIVSGLKRMVVECWKEGNSQRVKVGFLKFWERVRELSEEEKEGYEKLVVDVAAFRWAARECKGKIPWYLVPKDDEVFGDEGVLGNEGMPEKPEWMVEEVGIGRGIGRPSVLGLGVRSGTKEYMRAYREKRGRDLVEGLGE